MSELPMGWAECQIGDVTTIVGGGTPDSNDEQNFSTDEGISWMTPADLSGFQGVYVSRGKRFLTEKGFKGSSAKLLPEGTVLFSSRAPIGYVAIAANEISTNQGFKSFVCRDGLIAQYIYYWLKFAKPLAEGLASGTTFPEISGRNAARIPLRIAPTQEQLRIVAKVEELLSRVDAAQSRLTTIPRILKRFRQSVLAAACSGRLTADWREAHKNLEPGTAFLQKLHTKGKSKVPRVHLSRHNSFSPQNDFFELPNSWAVTNFGSVVASIRGGSTGVPENEPTKFPILRSSSVRPGVVDLEDVKYLPSETGQNEMNYLSEGDLLFTRLSGSLDYVANCAQVRGLEGRKIQYPDRLFCAKVIRPMNSTYCELVFAAPFVRAQVVEQAKSSAGHQRVSIVNITDQLIPVPPLAEQQEIVRRVEGLFKTADAIEARYRKAKAHVDNLTHSILARAFRGELVPQDPDDQPASVLLERIRRERAERSTPAKPTKRERRKRLLGD